MLESVADTSTLTTIYIQRGSVPGKSQIKNHNNFRSLHKRPTNCRQQQVTSYGHKDDNNKFLVKKWNEDPPLPYTQAWNDMEPEFVKHGDLVRYCFLLDKYQGPSI